MTMVLQFVIACIICTVVPALVGDLLIPNEALGKQFIMGILVTLAVSQCLFLPFIIYQHHFTPYFIVFVLIIVGLCLLSIKKRHMHYAQRCIRILDVNARIGEINIWMILAVILIGVQIVRVAIGHFFVYADNVLYIPVVNDIVETDKDYYLDYTLGVPGARETDRKYLFTTYFPYLASISKISGLHTAVLVQTLLPIILTISLYNLVWHYGIFLLKEKKTAWMFVFFFAVLVETIGGYDYTFANHAVSGIYFGKKIVFTILLPYIMLFISERTLLLENTVRILNRKEMVLLLIMITGVCAPSLMGTGLAPLMLLSIGIVLGFRKRSIMPLLQMGLAMSPSIIFILMVISYLYL